MGKKIFVSYKYADSLVQDLGLYEETEFYGTKFKKKITTTVRHYVDELSGLLEEDHIYKGEDDGESMDTLSDTTIGSKLGDKIFDSSVTIVLISKGMNNRSLPEKEQWIPWEISYSLREQSRKNQHSKTNAVIAVVLPDTSGSYDYFLTYDADCSCTNHNTPILFNILRRNMFNIKEPVTSTCKGQAIYHGEYSYILCVKWSSFKSNIDHFINRACKIRDNKEAYNITKNIP